MNDKHVEVFREEAYELLSDLEGSLLELEEAPEDADLIGKVFRVMHTIKGSGAMFGFDDIAAFTHEIENVYDRVRSGQILVSKQLISLTLEARDAIKSMLDSPGEAPPGRAVEEIVAAFKHIGTAEREGTESLPVGPSPSVGVSPSPPDETDSITYRIRFKPAPGIFLTGTNLLPLLDELRELGDCVMTAHFNQVPDLDAIDAEHCYLWWDIVLTTDRGIDAIKNVFIFVEDQAEISIQPVERDSRLILPGSTYKRIGEILVERGDASHEDVQQALKEKKYIGQMLVEKGIVTPEKVESALVEQQHLRKIREKAQSKEESISSLRVSSEKLDILVNLVGELVTAQARLTQAASVLANNDLTSIAEEIESLTAELRDNTLSIRMLPIGSTFARFKRLIRDLSAELGKEIEMNTEGAETELDKTVIEKLNDPLVHLIRNCVDHGIETPDERSSLGKPRTGAIHLSALHSGAHVVIEIKDDGKGLDREAILSKAIEKGLAVPGGEVHDRDVFNFIFTAGFSTAKQVTNISGRGVGMDVVKKTIDALGGSIEIASEPGRGTTVTIQLPLTLAIVDGLLVRIADAHFVLPLSIVEECVELTREDVNKAHGRNMANIRGEIVPYIKLRDEFRIPGGSPPIEQIVVTGVSGERVGFVVDDVVGEHQTVIKNLGKVYRNSDTVSGATILGDGSVALIVDALKLIGNAQSREGIL
jgi:two-component system chemotaxis sensor kinase CheA